MPNRDLHAQKQCQPPHMHQVDPRTKRVKGSFPTLVSYFKWMGKNRQRIDQDWLTFRFSIPCRDMKETKGKKNRWAIHMLRLLGLSFGTRWTCEVHTRVRNSTSHWTNWCQRVGWASKASVRQRCGVQNNFRRMMRTAIIVKKNNWKAKIGSTFTCGLGSLERLTAHAQITTEYGAYTRNSVCREVNPSVWEVEL